MRQDILRFSCFNILNYFVDHHYESFFFNELTKRRFVDDLRDGFVADIFEILFDRSVAEYVLGNKIYYRLAVKSVAYRVYPEIDIFNGYVKYVAYDKQHLTRAVRPSYVLSSSTDCKRCSRIDRLGVDKEVCDRAERNIAEIIEQRVFYIIGLYEVDDEIRNDYVVDIIFKKNLIGICDIFAYRYEIFYGEVAKYSYYVIAFFFRSMVAEEILESFSDVNFQNLSDRRINGFAVSYPLAAVIRKSEYVGNGEVIADHIVEAYRFLEPVEHCAFRARECVDKTNDLSVQKTGNTETERCIADRVFVYGSRFSVGSDVRLGFDLRLFIEYEEVADRNILERLFEIFALLFGFREVVYVEVEYSRKEVFARLVLIVRTLVFKGETFKSKVISRAHRNGIIQYVAERSVVVILDKPFGIRFDVFLNFLERIVGKLGEKILVYAANRVYLILFILTRAGHLALEAFIVSIQFIVYRHENGTDFVRQSHLDNAVGIGNHNVRSADQEEYIRRRAAVKHAQDLRTFLAVFVIPLTRFFIVLISADSVGISQEIADKYGVCDVIADIDYEISDLCGKHSVELEFGKRSVGVKLDIRLNFKYYAYKLCYFYISYTVKTEILLDYALVFVAFNDIVYVISEAVSVCVVFRYLIKDLANVFLYLIAVSSRRDYIAERYFEHVSYDKRKLSHGFFAERNFRDLSERYVVYETFDIIYRILSLKKVVNELADLFVSDLLEGFIVLEIGKTYIGKVIVEGSCPRFVLGIVDRVTEYLVR